MNANQLKLIAAVAMVADHIGFFLFPQLQILRIVGRLSFPIFAYFIFEGCRYTHKKMYYLGRVAAMGLVCMLVTYLVEGIVYGNILITFSLSLVLLFELRYIDDHRVQGKMAARPLCMLLLFALTVAFIFFLCSKIEVDYGFYGVLAPVCAEVMFVLFKSRGKNDYLRLRVLPLAGFTAALVSIACSASMVAIQFCSLAALPLLMLYNGQRGKRRMGMFFYLFYPLHIVLIQLAVIVLAQ